MTTTDQLLKSVHRYHPVAIPHGCCSRDYHGDNPEVKGSVPGAGPPTLQAGTPGATLLPLRRLLFTSRHFKVAKWTEQNINLNKKSAIVSPGTSFLGRKKSVTVQLNTDEKYLKIVCDAVTQGFKCGRF